MTAEQLDVEEMLGQAVAVPCDSRDCDREAAYIVWTKHRCAAHTAGSGFLCERCLKQLLTSPAVLHCPVTDEVWEPARHWMTHFESINRPPTPF